MIVDGDLRLVESLAILDYLELKYPDQPLTPAEPGAIATMKMLQLVTANELFPLMPSLIRQNQTPMSADLQQRLNNVLEFFTQHLQGKSYFGGDRLNLADIVAGSGILLMVRLSLTLDGYPFLQAWSDRLMLRPAWQQTRATDEDFEKWRAWIEKYLRVVNKIKQRAAR